MATSNFKLICLAGLTLIAGTAAIRSTGGCWGSRGLNTAYTTQYKGRDAAVVYEDILFGQDQYRLLIDGKETEEGKKSRCNYYFNVPYSCPATYTITDDHGKLVTVREYSYTVKDQ